MTERRPVQIELPFARPLEVPPRAPARGQRKALVIEAGAGTGKTTSIVRELLGILTSHPELAAERVVLVTFTEKAAGELSSRVRGAIAELHANLHLAEPSWPTENPIFMIAGGEREARRPAVERHFAQVERFAAQTIHSFCQRILRAFPIEAGLDPQFAIVEGFERERVYDQIYDRWLQSETGDSVGDAHLPEWETVFGHYRRLDNIRGAVFALLSKRDLIDDPRYSLGEMDEAEPLLHSVLAGIRSAEASAVTQVTDAPTRQFLDYVRTHAAPSDATVEIWLGYFAPIADALADANLGRAKSFKAYMKFLRGDDRGDTIFERLKRHRVAVTVRSLATRFNAFLEEEKQRLGIVDFDDLLFRTARLLENPGLLEEVRKAFDYIFVDEFQDTDRVQAGIVDKLARDSRGALVPGRVTIVGDPKQSIYAFRRADPETYERTVQSFLSDGAERSVLPDQYRSDAPLVDDLNVMFAELFSIPSTPSVARPSYEPLNAKRPGLIRELDARVTFLRSEEPGDGSVDERESVAVAEWIRARHAEGSPLCRFALLFRKLTNVDFYLETFDRYGIPYILPPTRAFLERPAAVDLIAVLRAIAFPFDTGAMIAAARTPWFALDDGEIVERLLPGGPADAGSPYERFRRGIEDYAGLARDVDVATLIDRLIADSGIELYYSALRNGRRSLLHLDALRDIAASFDLRAGEPIGEFVAEMTRRREESNDAEPAFLESEDAVSVMTVHAAKGLEFDTVILPDLGSPLRTDTTRVLAIDDPPSLLFSGRIANLAGEFRKVEDTPLGDIGDARAQAEVDRLFYVAVTRAKSDVVFVVDSRDSSQGFWKSFCRITGLDARAIAGRFPAAGERIVKDVAFGFVPVRCAFETMAPTMEDVLVRQPFVNEGIQSLLGVEVLEQDAISEQSEAMTAAEIAQRRAGVKNRAAGILLHRFLEVWDGNESQLEPLLDRLAIEQQADASVVARVGKRLATISASALAARLRSCTASANEVPIAYVDEHGSVVEGRIDLLLREGSQYVVLDYKSGKATPERSAKDREQVARYCSAVSRMSGNPCRGLLWYIDFESEAVVEV
ncbi:MAG TPA: UvrD-helicase domain-containing protein [Thermoanaerobaculia bacterium]|nr:UvrD-helicase domain-containing protein [Thermoanaerobaculia bacterium]